MVGLFENIIALSRVVLIQLDFVGYVSGLKLMLPENARRKDTKQYEEVDIPICDPAPTSVGENLIPISTLDKVSLSVNIEGQWLMNS